MQAGGDGDAVADLSADVEARVGVFAGFDGGEHAFVAEVVLGNRLRPEIMAEENGIAGEAEELAEVGEDFGEEAVGRSAGDFGLARAAGEDGEGDVTVGRATGEERGGEEGSEDFFVFECGYECAEAVEWVGDLFAAEAEEERGDGRMDDTGERGERAFGEGAVVGGGEGEFREGVAGEGEDDGGEIFGDDVAGGWDPGKLRVEG